MINKIRDFVGGKFILPYKKTHILKSTQWPFYILKEKVSFTSNCQKYFIGCNMLNKLYVDKYY